MNAILKKDADGSWWECGIDGEPFDNRLQAERCCSQLISRDTVPASGQQVEKKKVRKADTYPEIPMARRRVTG